MRLQDWLHNGDEFSIAFKVNYMSEDLLPVMVTSSLNRVTCRIRIKRNGMEGHQMIRSMTDNLDSAFIMCQDDTAYNNL